MNVRGSLESCAKGSAMNIHRAAPKFAETSAAASHLGEQARIQLQAQTSYITGLLEEVTRTSVDGVIAVGPIALRYILGAVGPVTTPDGEPITKENVIDLMESIVYERFPTDQPVRGVVKKITAPVESSRQLLDSLGKAVGEGRIALWSSSPADQQLLEQSSPPRVVPDDDAPCAEVIMNNLGGDQLDSDLRRSIEYAVDGCDGETRTSTITDKLTNTAPTKGLPDYVADSRDVLPEHPVQVTAGEPRNPVQPLVESATSVVSVPECS